MRHLIFPFHLHMSPCPFTLHILSSVYHGHERTPKWVDALCCLYVSLVDMEHEHKKTFYVKHVHVIIIVVETYMSAWKVSLIVQDFEPLQCGNLNLEENFELCMFLRNHPQSKIKSQVRQ